MVNSAGDIFQTCQTFASGDSRPRFKIDRFGDWQESFPQQDYAVDAGQSYSIHFNTSVQTIELEPVSSCTEPQAFTANLPSLYFRGTPNGWGLSSMQLVADNIWQIEVSFSGALNERFKVDAFGDWSQNYGAISSSSQLTRNGQDIPVDSAGTYTLEVNDETFTYTFRRQSTEDPVEEPVDEPIDVPVQDPIADTSGIDFREESIYFVLTARFYDGDSSNNYYNRDRVKIGDPHWRGDFKGLAAKLDYIKDLGFTAIWVTPPVENRSGLDYHGYHAYDWNRVDPRLESQDFGYQAFIDAAHEKGLKVIQDVVINHSSQYGIRDKVWIDHLPIKYYVPAGGVQGELDNDPYFGNLGDYKSAYRDDNDNSVAPLWFRQRHQSDPDGIVPLVDPKTGVTVPLAGYNPGRFFGIDPQTLDPDWYHLDGFIAGGDWENPLPLQRKHLAGDTIDLATENENVKNYLNTAIKTYLDMGVDAIRVDTAKHIERDELLSYTREWQAHKPGLFVFGEVLVKGLGFGNELGNDNASAAIRPWWYTRTGNDLSTPQGDSNFSVLDFPLFSTFRDNVTRGSLSGIKSALDRDWTYADPTQLVTFFQNHDVGPDNDFKYRFCCDPANAALAYNVLWTVRGIPTLYYGEEVMFMAGAPQDIANANDTVDTTGRAYYGGVLNNPETPAHPLYQHIKRLNQIRRSVPALQKGQMASIQEWGSGMSFVREHGDSYVAVGLAAGASQQISIGQVKNGSYREVVTGKVVVVSDNTLRFNVKAYSIGAYVLNGRGQIGVGGTYLR